MKRFHITSIRKKIILMVILCTCISIGLFLGYTWQNVTRRIKETIENNYQNSLNTVGSQLDQAFVEMHYTASGLTYRGGLVSQVTDYLMVTDNIEKKELSSLIRNQLSLNDFSSQVIGLIAFYYPGNPNISILSNTALTTFHADATYFFAHEPYTEFIYPSTSILGSQTVLALSRYAGNYAEQDFFVYLESDIDFISELFGQLKDHESNQLPICLVDSDGNVVYAIGDEAPIIGTLFDYEKIKKSYTPFVYSTESWKLYLCVPNTDYWAIYRTLFGEFVVILLFYIITYIMLAIFICRVTYKPLNTFIKELTHYEASGLYSHRVIHTQEFDEYTQKIEQMRLEIFRLISRVRQESEQNARLENELLLSRINPHFIHNCINNIQLQAFDEGYNQLSDTLQALNNLLYHNLGKAKITTLRDEIRAVDDYIYLQQRIRSFIYEREIKLPDEILDLNMPSFILQPLVENCFQHSQIINLRIRLYAYIQNNIITLCLEDNGLGISSQKQRQLNENFLVTATQDMGIGLGYVCSSLKMHFGDLVKMKIENKTEECGTRVIICIDLKDYFIT